MPNVNPEILVWARETAGLARDQAAKKLGLQDSPKSSGSQKLALLEMGEKEPTRKQLTTMADRYRRPLLVFYLSEPPARGERGADFRGRQQESSPEAEGRVDALIRDIRARQDMIRSILEDEDEMERLPFIGSIATTQGVEAAVSAVADLLKVTPEEIYNQKDAVAAFNLLRTSAESAGVFVLLKGDMGNYLSAFDTTELRGFALADPVAPFIVINDQDARTAWSFTLVHELVHLLRGETGFGSSKSDANNERFCDRVAGSFFLPDKELGQLRLDSSSTAGEILKRISEFARPRNLSLLMVAFNARQAQLISQGTYDELGSTVRQQWRADKERERERRRQQEKKTGPDYYVVRRHRLGNRITSLVGRMLSTEALSTAKAARILGIKPRQVQTLLGNEPRL